MKSFFVVILILLVGCKSKSTQTTTIDSSKNVIQIPFNSHGKEAVWISSFSEDSIPRLLSNKLIEIDSSIFQNADSSKSLFKQSARQFAFVARTAYLWNIAYKHIGADTHYHLMVFTIGNDEVKDVRVFTSSEKLESIDQVKNAVLKRKLQLRDLKSSVEADKF